jgi:methylenetetrahydrofolate reductase (NADPH)
MLAKAGGKADPVTLQDRLGSGRFAVTAELSPPRGAGTAAMAELAGVLRDWVDAVNVTDNQGSNVRMASWAGSVAVAAAGLEPIMQMTCRDRNRIALQSDLLGATALGVRNVLIMTGDHPSNGDHPTAKPVFDLNSFELLEAVRAMRDDGLLLSGRRLDPAPDCFLGAVENPFSAPGTHPAARLGQKVAAGAQFVQTQFVFDVPAFAGWMEQVREFGLHEQCHILAGVGVIRTQGALDFIADKLPGVDVPPEVYQRLHAAADIAAESVTLAAETIRQLREIPGVAGVHVLAAGHERAIPDLLAGAGLAELSHGR